MIRLGRALLAALAGCVAVPASVGAVPGVVTEFPIPTAASGATGITDGPDGNLWFTEFSTTANRIGRITADGTGGGGTPGTGTGTGTQSPPANDLLAIAKADNVDPVIVGSTVFYAILVTNNDTSTNAFNVQVTDALPDGLELVSVAASQGNCTGTAALTCGLGTIGPRGSAFISLVVRATRTGALTNVARVSTSSPDPFPANNESSQQTTVLEAFSASLAGSRRCFLLDDRACLVDVESSANGNATATGTLVVPGSPRASARFRFRRARKRVVAFEEQTLRLRAGRRARRAVRRALARHRRVRARIRVVIQDGAGHRVVRRRTLRVVR